MGDLDSINNKKYDFSDSAFDTYQNIDFFDGVEGMEDVNHTDEVQSRQEQTDDFELFEDIDFMDGVEDDYDLLDHSHVQNKINENHTRMNNQVRRNPTVRLAKSTEPVAVRRKAEQQKQKRRSTPVHVERKEEPRQKRQSIFKSLGFYCIVATISLAIVVLIFFMQLFNNSGTTSQSSYQDAVEQGTTK